MPDIRTTHVGSLPRPRDVADMILARERGEPIDAAGFDEAVRAGVEAVIARQRETGISLPSDGEMAKVSYATYVKERLTGFEGDSPRRTPADLEAYPGFRDKLVKSGATPPYKRPRNVGPIAIKDLSSLQRDIANMKAGLAKAGYARGFMNAASPGTIAVFQPTEHYPSHEAYLDSIAEAMRAEYEAIVAAGLDLQIDSPDLAMGRHMQFKAVSDGQFLKAAERNVETLNHALRNVPGERVRMHVCWGNYEGPHHRDIPLSAIIGVVLKAKPRTLLFEAANPRHAHEWKVWQETRIPDDVVLAPGVISSTTNYIEHPEVVAERIGKFTRIVGAERVIAGSDCGFATFAGYGLIDPDIAWAKLRTLVEGASLAA
jgi:5-methyltetrahydropteroyltriglutamate--homocysteine methyltransferase